MRRADSDAGADMRETSTTGADPATRGTAGLIAPARAAPLPRLGGASGRRARPHQGQ